MSQFLSMRDHDEYGRPPRPGSQASFERGMSLWETTRSGRSATESDHERESKELPRNHTEEIRRREESPKSKPSIRSIRAGLSDRWSRTSYTLRLFWSIDLSFRAMSDRRTSFPDYHHCRTSCS